MLVIQVHVRVKPDAIDAFKAATTENARNSVLEAGVARFDFFPHADDPTRFVLIEVYGTPEAPAAHKDSRHYQVWRDTVTDMMAEPRSSVRLAPVFPAAGAW